MKKRNRTIFYIMVLSIFIISINSGRSEAGNFTLNAIDVGHYYNTGLHQPTVLGYAAGWFGSDLAQEWHDFFVFDLTPVAGGGFVIEAKLRLYAGGYDSVDETETFSLHDVTKPVSTLVSVHPEGNSEGIAIFDDLADGQFYGEKVMSFEDQAQIISIPLTWPTCMDIRSHINSEDYLFALGGSLTTIDPTSGRKQIVFSSTPLPENNTWQLVLRTNANITVFFNSDQTVTEQVNGFFFDPGSQVTLEIDRGNDGTVEYTQTNGLDGDGVVRFWLVGVISPLQPGDLVRLFDDQDPQTTKEHVVDYLTLDAINPVADTLSGKADPGENVYAYVWQGPNIETIADTSGTWSADFQAVTDLVAGTTGYVQTDDGDGDHTQINWEIPDPIPTTDIDISTDPLLTGIDHEDPKINTKSKGAVTVSILGSETFDVTNVNVTPDSPTFEGAAPYHNHLEDVNLDGFDDLVMQFVIQDTSIQEGDTEACLTFTFTYGYLEHTLCHGIKAK